MSIFRLLWPAILSIMAFPGAGLASASNPMKIGSKNFTESYVLTEIFAQWLERHGIEVQRRSGLGGTLICFEALISGEIDIYPEYSGTLEQAILKLPGKVSHRALQDSVRVRHSLELLKPLGFNNTYAIAVPLALARERGLQSIGDLAGHADLAYGFSYEFMNRKDGWPGLARAYGLKAVPNAMIHGLAYQAVADGKISVTDVYSTDGDIEKYDLVVLDDDKAYFPIYLAAPLVRASVPDSIKRILNLLSNRISADAMRRMNAAVLLEGKSFKEVASGFVQSAASETGKGLASRSQAKGWWSHLFRRVVTHLELTGIALLAGILVAVPMGVLIYRVGFLARPVMYGVGLLQTIPSIALLAFMIPMFGIGALPAIVALFLYSLLPILRNTVAALTSLDPVLKKVSVGIGLTAWQRLRHVELPLASPVILSGIKTAAVINIGTATLAAFIGAGGLGEPIVTGLALNDATLILEGAVPAAILAILVEFAFEMLERGIIPRHLRGGREGRP